MIIIALNLCNARPIPLGGTILAMEILFGGINQAIVLSPSLASPGPRGELR